MSSNSTAASNSADNADRSRSSAMARRPPPTRGDGGGAAGAAGADVGALGATASVSFAQLLRFNVGVGGAPHLLSWMPGLADLFVVDPAVDDTRNGAPTVDGDESSSRRRRTEAAAAGVAAGEISRGKGGRGGGGAREGGGGGGGEESGAKEVTASLDAGPRIAEWHRDLGTVLHVATMADSVVDSLLVTHRWQGGGGATSGDADCGGGGGSGSAAAAAAATAGGQRRCLGIIRAFTLPGLVHTLGAATGNARDVLACVVHHRVASTAILAQAVATASTMVEPVLLSKLAAPPAGGGGGAAAATAAVAEPLVSASQTGGFTAGEAGGGAAAAVVSRDVVGSATHSHLEEEAEEAGKQATRPVTALADADDVAILRAFVNWCARCGFDLPPALGCVGERPPVRHTIALLQEGAPPAAAGSNGGADGRITSSGGCAEKVRWPMQSAHDLHVLAVDVACGGGGGRGGGGGGLHVRCRGGVLVLLLVVEGGGGAFGRLGSWLTRAHWRSAGLAVWCWVRVRCCRSLLLSDRLRAATFCRGLRPREKLKHPFQQQQRWHHQQWGV
jgi:hypothetical protein